MSPSRQVVAVVGSGVAGVAAAVEAAERGASVTVFEAAAEYGGASVMSGAACCVVGTQLQRDQGIVDNVDLALEDWVKMGGDLVDVAWATQYLRDSNRDVFEYCEKLGVRWIWVAAPEGNSVPRWHWPDGHGRKIVEQLVNRATELGVHFELNTNVLSLDIGEEGVRGIEVRGSDGVQSVPVDAVIVCAGGFVSNHELTLRLAPQLRDLSRLLQGGAPTALGSGYDLLDNVDAEFAALDAIWIYPNGTPDPQDPTGHRGLGVRGVETEVWLNSSGARFHDETLRGGHSGSAALLAQEGHSAWCVFNASEMSNVLLIDNEFYSTPAGPNVEAMKSFWAESPYAVRADSIAELADAMGLPRDRAVESIAAFNDGIRDGIVDVTTGRDLSTAKPIADSSYCAIQFFPLAQKNFGGVRTDLECRVQHREGGSVKGLYAAGEVAGMAGGHINGAAALEGTMFGPSLYSGRIAGRTVALDHNHESRSAQSVTK